MFRKPKLVADKSGHLLDLRWNHNLWLTSHRLLSRKKLGGMFWKLDFCWQVGNFCVLWSSILLPKAPSFGTETRLDCIHRQSTTCSRVLTLLRYTLQFSLLFWLLQYNGNVFLLLYCTYTDVNTSFFCRWRCEPFFRGTVEEWVVFGSLSISVHSIVTVVVIWTSWLGEFSVRSFWFCKKPDLLRKRHACFQL